MRHGRDRHRERDGNHEMNHVKDGVHFDGHDSDGCFGGSDFDLGSELDPSNSGSSSVDRFVTTYRGDSGHSLGDVGNYDSEHRVALPGLL